MSEGKDDRSEGKEAEDKGGPDIFDAVSSFCMSSGFEGTYGYIIFDKTLHR